MASRGGDEEDDIYGHDRARSDAAAAELFSVRKPAGGKAPVKPPLPPRPAGVSTPPQTEKIFAGEKPAGKKSAAEVIPADYLQSLPESARATLAKVTAKKAGTDDAADVFGAAMTVRHATIVSLHQNQEGKEGLLTRGSDGMGEQNPLEADYSTLDFTSDEINLASLAGTRWLWEGVMVVRVYVMDEGGAARTCEACVG